MLLMMQRCQTMARIMALFEKYKNGASKYNAYAGF